MSFHPGRTLLAPRRDACRAEREPGAEVVGRSMGTDSVRDRPAWRADGYLPCPCCPPPPLLSGAWTCSAMARRIRSVGQGQRMSGPGASDDRLAGCHSGSSWASAGILRLAFLLAYVRTVRTELGLAGVPVFLPPFPPPPNPRQPLASVRCRSCSVLQSALTPCCRCGCCNGAQVAWTWGTAWRGGPGEGARRCAEWRGVEKPRRTARRERDVCVRRPRVGQAATKTLLRGKLWGNRRSSSHHCWAEDVARRWLPLLLSSFPTGAPRTCPLFRRRQPTEVCSCARMSRRGEARPASAEHRAPSTKHRARLTWHRSHGAPCRCACMPSQRVALC